MAAPLNRQPNGLLDFLGVKNGGENPAELGRVLLPQVDVLPLYENTAGPALGAVSGNLSAGVVLFGPAGATSSPGATWHFRNVGMYLAVSGAGDVGYVRIGAQYNGVFVPMSGTIQVNQTIAAWPSVVSVAISDFWLPPGWSLAYEGAAVVNTPGFSAAWWGYEYRW